MTATYQPEIPEKYVERLFELNEKVAIVTGGASGLGEAIALGFSQAGAHVVIADVDAVRTNALLEAVSNYRSPPIFIECDVTDKSSVDHLTHETLAAFGQIDILVNSAGMAFRSVAEDFPEEMYDQIIDLNLKGTFIPCQVVGKSMLKARSGSIINLASIGATPTDDREKVRGLVEKSDNAIIVASYGTFSLGVNIQRIHKKTSQANNTT